MDSGNSGSLQSSSGGDEEYDSRGAGSISSFLNPSTNFGSNLQTQFLAQQQQPTFFYPQTQNPHDTSFQQSANSQYNNNNDLLWPRGLRSDHNFTHFGNLTTSSPSSSLNSAQTLLGTAAQGLQGHFTGSASLPLQCSVEAAANAVRGSSSAQLEPGQPPNAVKNPKKRTRASRRAPTTVLTTDTTNFRQMVQEFTGIPAAPFTGSAYSRRLDLFSTAGSAMRTGHLDGVGPFYPLRPSAQKFQLSPFMSQSSASTSTTTTTTSLLSSSMIDALMPTNHNTSTTNSSVGTTNIPSTTTTNFQLGSSDDIGIQKQGHNNMFDMQNQILSFQPLVKNHSQVSANDHSVLWRGGHDENNQVITSITNFDVISSSQHVSSSSGYKLNCSGSSTSEFLNTEKGLENVCSTAAGDQGTVASWTCTPSE